MSRYQKNLTRFIETRQKAHDGRRKEIRDILRSTVEEIVALFPELSRMLLVGSAVRGGFSEHSDIDVMIAGIQKRDYFRLHSYLEKKLNGRVDLIMEEDLNIEQLKHITKDHEVIYDKAKSRF